ncbi:MAG TPA: pyridoxamine 5'-phosphate oxidase [Bacteroidia bacterium]|jgi:pyridoxamine 5'-phosphate oxidase|nr:pyridoxamine 5'-phosphate oxidase [Bacteroidia bacterium]
MSDWKKDIASIHHQFEAGELNESVMDRNPILQFEKWFAIALEENVEEQNSFVLSTATPNGVPSARVVLLKGVDTRGFIFFTNYESRKGKELEENPHACMTFYWPTLHRQIRIEGEVQRVSEKESKEYFHSRPKASQAGAYISPQSQPISSRKELDEKHAAFMAQHESIEIPAPEYWGGYRIIPKHFEFWQGRTNRLHDRIAYTLDKDKWRIYRIAP